MKGLEEFTTFTQIAAPVFYAILCIKSRGNKGRFSPYKNNDYIRIKSNDNGILKNILF
jgi:hypothetical protein